MRRKIVLLLITIAVVGLVAGGRGASAHECPRDDPNHPNCQPTTVVHNWRGNFVPLFGTRDVRCDTSDPKTGEECAKRRQEEQRWRDEWGCDSQWCWWIKINMSGNPTEDGKPNSVHAGTAADHSLTEFAHQSEGHGSTEGNHDAHGGSVYADICLASDEGTSYEGKAGECREMKDTQVGLNIIDHDPCGLPVNPDDPTNLGIPIPCSDEYHTVRPLDPDDTQGQLGDDAEELQRDVNDPHEWVCGYEYKDQNPTNGAVPQYCID